jgi:hypothetical protein
VVADPKAAPVIRDRGVFRILHLEWRECALCGEVEPLSLHHVLKHPKDDVRQNLVMVCGSGTTLCHGELEAHDDDAVAALGSVIVTSRPDIIEHMIWRLNGPAAADAYLRRYLHASLPASWL